MIAQRANRSAGFFGWFTRTWGYPGLGAKGTTV
jgi:hypothetical protein